MLSHFYHCCFIFSFLLWLWKRLHLHRHRRAPASSSCQPCAMSYFKSCLMDKSVLVCSLIISPLVCVYCSAFNHYIRNLPWIISLSLCVRMGQCKDADLYQVHLLDSRCKLHHHVVDILAKPWGTRLSHHLNYIFNCVPTVGGCWVVK
jgi:hypothetical protein